MSNIVVVSGHPDLDTSNANTVILNALEHRFDSIAVRRLDTLYSGQVSAMESDRSRSL